MSTPSGHKAEVFRVARVRPHPNADRLELAAFAGYQSVVAKGEYREGDLAVFVPPDSSVPVSQPEFSFLAPRANQSGVARIKAVSLRGEPSFGLVVKARPGMAEGDDAAALLGVEHYEPPLPGDAGKKGLLLGGEAAPSPRGEPQGKYDLESFRRYANDVFSPGEPVLVTEKLDGANARYVYQDGAFHCGSRTGWKKEFPEYSHVTEEYLARQGVEAERAKEIIGRLHSGTPKRNLWWDILHRTPALEKFLRDNEGVFVYGEAYGAVNCIKYGFDDVNRFAAFDVWMEGKFLSPCVSHCWLDNEGVPTVPKVAGYSSRGLPLGVPFDFDALCSLAEGPTHAPGARPGTVSEGVVVSSMAERSHPKAGRAKLKIVSVNFLEKYR